MPEEKTFQASPAGTARAAAMAAADMYGSEQLDEHATAILDAWTAKMKGLNDELTQEAAEKAQKAEAKAKGQAVAEAEFEPWTPVWPWPYPWWNVIVAGPYQPAPSPGGPFLPHKIIQPQEPALLLGAVWLNPAPINWWPPGPSAATVMGAFQLTIRFETINLTTVTDGPDPNPIVMNPIGGWPFGPPWFKVFWVSIGGNFFPTPADGRPNLYELNTTADAHGPVPSPFAGFSTWVYDPDLEPAIWPPFIRPAVPPHWQYDNPMRFLVYRP